MSVAELGPVYVPQNAPAPAAVPAAAQFAVVQARQVYAGFWLRVIAYLIDTMAIAIPLGFIGAFNPSAFVVFPDAGAKSLAALPQLTPLAILVTFPAVWLYYALFESSSWQATPGKRILHLQVTDLQGRRITFARATVRYFAKILSSLTFLVGYVLAGFTAKKQALHDILAGCLVLRKQ